MISTAITTVELAASLIRLFEGVRLTSYQDTGGKWTIGYGHTGPVNGIPLGFGVTLSQEDAEMFLAQDAAPLLTAVQGRPMVEAAALVSFGYNCGIMAMRGAMIGTIHPSLWIHDALGHELPALVKRRAVEVGLMEASQQMMAHPVVAK